VIFTLMPAGPLVGEKSLIVGAVAVLVGVFVGA
jgi:hypothetical protein